TATLTCQTRTTRLRRGPSLQIPPSNLKGGPMKFNANIDPKADARAAIEQAKYVDSLGYDGILMQDHAYLDQFSETTTLLAAIGAVTENVTIGANVLTAPY